MKSDIDELIKATEEAGKSEGRVYYTRQIKGLILVMQQVEGGLMVSRKYVIEKLNMILNGGIGFHPSILEKLNDK